ncbi:2-hydroxyacid dehydrogenase [Bordetella petrii]|uniref:2-hydroxyacid dehydrogenase n=1 Tax=Bordetella petrii TaxID=94624 RepID=UPI0004B17156|nr:2-hydroxyacid dehydrogenase [Bordetella petrii]
MMDIVFHGQTARQYVQVFGAALRSPARIRCVPDMLEADDDVHAYRHADVIVGNRLDAAMPRPLRTRLYQVCATGYDRVDFALLPPGAAVCNCYGHEPAIAEYVMAAMLGRCVPLAEAHARLARGDWHYRAGQPSSLRGELGGATLGLLGYGRIAQVVARRARAFGMHILAANRSRVAVPDQADAWFDLGELDEFYARADFFVVSLPLLRATEGLVDAAAFACMRPHAVLINVGRGPVVDERALYDALAERRIGGAVIDTWYQYPARAGQALPPSNLPFERLDNVVMTSHMSAWTHGTIDRRARMMAANVDACAEGRAPQHQLPR